MLKIKLSNVNLCDNDIINKLCEMLENRYQVIHLDLSWAKLSPKHLNQIITTLNNRREKTIRNLNLSYNSLV